MNNQENYTIAEFVSLPSEGKLYNELIDPQVELRSMTTAEEMRRLAPTENNYENLCSIIDDCIVKGPQMSSYDMCLGDYQFLLYKLRIVTYGSSYVVNSTCPYCRAVTKETIQLEELPVKTYNEEMLKYKEIELPMSKHMITLKMITPRMLDDLRHKVDEFKRKANSKAIDSAVLYSICNVIEYIDGERYNDFRKEEFVKKLPMKDTNMIANYSDKLASYIGIDTEVTFKCDMCGLMHKAKLPMTNEFFRPALDE